MYSTRGYLVLLFILALSITTISTPLTTQIAFAETRSNRIAELPYKEGDWLEYRMNIELSALNISCQVRFKLTIIEVDVELRRIKVSSSMVEVGGDEECKELEIFRGVETFDLSKTPEQAGLSFFVDPKYTGVFETTYYNVNFTIEYRKGVLLRAELRGPGAYATIRLIDSSIPEFSRKDALLVALVVVGLVIAVVAIPVVILLRVMKRTTG